MDLMAKVDGRIRIHSSFVHVGHVVHQMAAAGASLKQVFFAVEIVFFYEKE
jgi:hypothetical protein